MVAKVPPDPGLRAWTGRRQVDGFWDWEVAMGGPLHFLTCAVPAHFTSEPPYKTAGRARVTFRIP
jgi:hypothetical protein